MKLPLHIESKGEYHCHRIIERIEREVDNRNVVTIKVPRIKQYISNLENINKSVN